MRTFPALSSAPMLLFALVACGGESKQQAARDSAAAAAAPLPPRPAVAGSPGCPSDGRWTPCALLDRVSRSGLVFKEAGDTTRVPFLAVPGVRYKVGSVATLVAFIYPDSAALARDFAAIDTVRVAAKGDTATAWPSVPVVVRSANLLVLVFDGSETQVERIQLAITAGAPQPTAPEKPAILPVMPNAKPSDKP